MKRIPHILKTYKGNDRPSNCIWVDTETKHYTTKDGKQLHYLWFGWACHQRREHGDVWSKPDWFRFETIEEFWTWVESKTRKKSRLYIFAHNGQFDLPVLDAFLELPHRGWELDNAIIECPPMMVVWKRDTASIKFVDTLNIWRTSLDALGESIGIGKLAMPLASDSQEEWDLYCQRDTEVIRQALLTWLSFLHDNDLGGFSVTLASQAFNTYRHRFMNVPIFVHDRQRALDTERRAYVGGRTECFKMGEHKGKFYYIDVNSMYPSVMFTEEYPHKLVDSYHNVSHNELGSWLEQWAVIADVVIETEVPAYPKIHDNKLIFPVGTFNTSLAGPELKHAYHHGHIKSIGHTCIYEKAPLFKEFIAFMYSMRMQAKKDGDEVKSWLYKIMMNSLYGKFGQRGRRFETDSHTDDLSIEVWTEINAETLEITNYRMFGGIIQKWVEEGESRESFPGIAAYVTSYARMKLWDAMYRAGMENCYYCDTDSLVVNEAGFSRLGDIINADSLGYWAVEDILSSLELRGPKDYRFDSIEKTKGVRKNAKWVTDSIAEQAYFVGIKGLLRDYNLSMPVVYDITKIQSRNYTKGIIDSEFNVQPLRLALD
tara:strand:- start:5302 stop:7098 length:1797 start_codon:yes stop_codon:yes gene_type:complete